MTNYVQGLPALDDISETIASVPGYTDDLRAALLGQDGRSGADAYDTGWINIPLISPLTGTVQARAIGSRVSWRGTVAPSGDWGAANTNVAVVNAVPVFLQPAQGTVFVCAYTGGSATAVFRVALTGSLLNVRPSAASLTGGVYLNFDYMRD
jgi:hypothetical protein